MSTQYSNCPTCGAQTQTVRCDNCTNIIPNDASPAVSGRVWNEEIVGYLPITLCKNCEDQPLQLLTVAKNASSSA